MCLRVVVRLMSSVGDRKAEEPVAEVDPSVAGEDGDASPDPLLPDHPARMLLAGRLERRPPVHVLDRTHPVRGMADVSLPHGIG